MRRMVKMKMKMMVALNECLTCLPELLSSIRLLYVMPLAAVHMKGEQEGV